MSITQTKNRVMFKILYTLRTKLRYDLISGRRLRAKSCDLVKIGSTDCGWILPKKSLPKLRICYCVGAGEDISFDLALAKEHGMEVHTFDPTPRAIAHYESLPPSDRASISFHPWGLWIEDSVFRFFEPSDPSHVSHSIVNLQNTKNGFDAQCYTYSTITQALAHSKVDLLKIDIEGAELQVLPEVIQSPNAPDIILVEFDTIRPPARISEWLLVRAACAQLRRAGYELIVAEKSNYTFVKEPLQ